MLSPEWADISTNTKINQRPKATFKTNMTKTGVTQVVLQNCAVYFFLWIYRIHQYRIIKQEGFVLQNSLNLVNSEIVL